MGALHFHLDTQIAPQRMTGQSTLTLFSQKGGQSFLTSALKKWHPAFFHHFCVKLPCFTYTKPMLLTVGHIHMYE